MRRLFAVIKKEFRQILRDIRTLILLIFFPPLLLLLFGYALSFDVKHIQTGVFDLDASEHSRALVQSLVAGESFDLLKIYEHYQDIDQGLDSGKISVAIVIPSGFGESIESGQTAKIQSLIDGSNSQVATITQGYVNAFVQTYAIKIVSKQLLRSGYDRIEPPVNLQPQIWYNPELKSSVFLIPGLVVLILMISCVISTALSIVREKERGTIEQLLVSPLNSSQIIIGKTIPYALVSLISASIIIGVGYVAFSMPIKGSIPLLFLASVLFVISALSQGILISTITKSQQVAYQVAALTSILPSLLLSGFVFPIKNMPHVIQLITYLVPARYYVELLRSILLKGVGIEVYWHQLVSLAIFSALMLLVATIRMSRVKLA